MAPDRRAVGRRAAALVAIACAAAALASPAVAQQATPRAPIYTCTLNGKKLTSDRTIPECGNQEQRVLNSDGSVNRVIQPTPTDDERAAIEQRQRDAEAERVQRNDAVRRDRNQMQRYPDEAAHRKAREKALDDIRKAVQISKERIKLLMIERKPLLDESEFYVGKSMPTKLKTGLDANDASLEAQKALIQNQESEVKRINDLYDLELARLKKLWNGAQPGTLGPVPQVAANAPPALAVGAGPLKKAGAQ